jgi:hypothetical protein
VFGVESGCRDGRDWTLGGVCLSTARLVRMRRCLAGRGGGRRVGAGGMLGCQGYFGKVHRGGEVAGSGGREWERERGSNTSIQLLECWRRRCWMSMVRADITIISAVCYFA